MCFFTFSTLFIVLIEHEKDLQSSKVQKHVDLSCLPDNSEFGFFRPPTWKFCLVWCSKVDIQPGVCFPKALLVNWSHFHLEPLEPPPLWTIWLFPNQSSNDHSQTVLYFCGWNYSSWSVFKSI